MKNLKYENNIEMKTSSNKLDEQTLAFYEKIEQILA